MLKALFLILKKKKNVKAIKEWLAALACGFVFWGIFFAAAILSGAITK